MASAKYEIVSADSLVIDDAFHEKMGSLDDMESTSLASNIKKDGEVLSPVFVWERDGDLVVVDGRNRVMNARAAGLTVPIRRLDFSSNDEAMMWALRHQLGRRNWNPSQKAYVANKLLRETGEASISKTAELANVSKRLACTAVSVIRELAGADESITSLLEQGHAISVSDAIALAAVDVGKQKEVARSVRTGQNPDFATAIKKLIGKDARAKGAGEKVRRAAAKKLKSETADVETGKEKKARKPKPSKGGKGSGKGAKSSKEAAKKATATTEKPVEIPPDKLAEAVAAEWRARVTGWISSYKSVMKSLPEGLKFLDCRREAVTQQSEQIVNTVRLSIRDLLVCLHCNGKGCSSCEGHGFLPRSNGELSGMKFPKKDKDKD